MSPRTSEKLLAHGSSRSTLSTFGSYPSGVLFTFHQSQAVFQMMPTCDESGALHKSLYSY